MRNWPIVLSIWIACVISAVLVKLLFFSYIKFGTVTIEEMIQGIPQDDKRLLDYVYNFHLFPPSFSEYNLKFEKELESPYLINRIINYYIREILGEMKGFFVECRAYDGELMSKTLELERKYNWSGLLIEPDPISFSTLLKKRRKAWKSNVCLSPDPVAQNLDFLRRVNYNSNDTTEIPSLLLKDHQNNNSRQLYWKKMKVPCFPLFSLVTALQVKVIDYLSLDSQGLELQILLNVPWELITIKVISINAQFIPEGVDSLTSFMESKEYLLVSQVNQDYIFAHSSLNYSLTMIPQEDEDGNDDDIRLNRLS